MKNIRYNLDQLLTGQEDMNKGATNIDDILEVLEGQVGPLIERFVGDSSTAYYAAQFKWNNQSAELNSMFVQGSNQVGNSAQNMNQADTTGANRFRA